MTATSEAIRELRQAGVRRIRLIDFFRRFAVDGENLADHVHDNPGDLSFAILEDS